MRSIDPATRQFYIIVPPSVSSERLQRVNTLVRGTIPTPIPLSLSLSAGHRTVTSTPYTAIYTAAPKLRKDPSRVAERVHAQSGEGGQRTEDVPTDVYGPDTEIDTSIGEISTFYLLILLNNCEISQ